MPPDSPKMQTAGRQSCIRMLVLPTKVGWVPVLVDVLAGLCHLQVRNPSRKILGGRVFDWRNLAKSVLYIPRGLLAY